MYRIILLSLYFAGASLVLTASLPNVLGQEATTTTWTGTLDARGTELRLEVDVTEAAGQTTGELRSLDQNVTLNMEDVKTGGTSLRFSISEIGAKFVGKYAKDRNSAKGTFSQSGLKLPLTLTKRDSKATAAENMPGKKQKETLKEAWVGKVQMGVMEPVMQFRVVTLESGETAAYFDSVTEGRTGFDATWSIDGQTLRFDVAKINLQFEGTLNEAKDSADGTWSQGGRNLPLVLKKKSAEYDNVNVWANRPQRPVGPFPYDAEEVTFDNESDGVTLAGTLTLPKKPGRHPVVVLISGSGPQDRDETLMGHKPFLVLADYLSRRGIAVLRYDDRGTAESTGNFEPATTEDFARDASAAVEFLKKHDRINVSEIGLAGHSEGGLIAPMVVGLRDDIDFVVLLAATGVDGAAISISQNEALALAIGADETDIKLGLAVSRAAIDVVVKASPGSDFSEELDRAIESVIQTIPESKREEAGKELRSEIQSQKKRLASNWMRFFLAYDPRPALTKIKCPVLAIIGSKDLQVLPDLNMPEIRQALEKGGNKDFELVTLDGLNHLFQKCETGAMSEYVSIQETFNPMALKKVGDWIVERVSVIQ